MTLQRIPYQTRAADQIARRYQLLTSERRRPIEHIDWPTPFYQALGALTGSGKTVILADAVAQIRALMTAEPIVLWISKARAVVEQTYANFESGGKYEGLIEGFLLSYLSNLNAERIRDDTQPIIALTTVGTFNQKDKGEGTLRVHRTAQDSGDDPLWTTLTERRNAAGARRPLVVVYDEAQNLADQQVDLLLELEPDVLLAASATMRTPGKLGRVINRLKEAGWSEEATADDPAQAPRKGLVTAIRSRDAVEAGLVKRQIVLGGYATEMETALNDMIAEFRATTQKAADLDLAFRPKGIYVCRTNISQEDGSPDNHARPFVERKAPPILIWRHLVEQAGVDPAEIAVYCDLKVDRKNHPLPPEFVLFSGGDDDFGAFTTSNYKHIIFNLSLQEGWDDPACAFAYIDKSMGSSIQVEQVIGRVLRQPGGTHYPDPDLNTAHFYIRIDSRQEFPRILDVVRRKIASEMPEVKLDGFTDRGDRRRARQEPKARLVVPQIHIDADAACDPLQGVVDMINDYTTDNGVNTHGPGDLTRAVQSIGDGAQAAVETRESKHSNRVIARWLIRRAMQTLYPEAAATVDWADPRFEARVEVTSRAANHLRGEAEKLVDTYLAHAELAFEDTNPYVVSGILTTPDKLETFTHAGHEAYSDLNPVELDFARALDATGLTWVRNPSNGGYSIPLLEKGDARRFFPDFLVWKEDKIYALDPKGHHLINKDAGLKLLAIRDERGRQRVVVRLITEGRWSHEPIKRLASGGYSMWRITSAGQRRCTYHQTPEDTLKKCLDL